MTQITLIMGRCPPESRQGQHVATADHSSEGIIPAQLEQNQTPRHGPLVTLTLSLAPLVSRHAGFLRPAGLSNPFPVQPRFFPVPLYASFSSLLLVTSSDKLFLTFLIPSNLSVQPSSTKFGYFVALITAANVLLICESGMYTPRDQKQISLYTQLCPEC